MTTNEENGAPGELHSAQLILDSRALRDESKRLIHDSRLLIDRSWDALAGVLKRYIEPSPPAKR